MTDIKAYGRAHNREPGIRCWCHQTHEPAEDNAAPGHRPTPEDGHG